MDFRIRSKLISTAVMLVGILLSGLFFFLYWILQDRVTWADWLMTLSFASFLGGAFIAFIIQFGLRYNLSRKRVAGFFMVIGWVALALFSTLLETVRVVSTQAARGISYAITIGGLVVLVIPGFLLMLLPWPPRFRRPADKHPNAPVDEDY